MRISKKIATAAAALALAAGLLLPAGPRRRPDDPAAPFFPGFRRGESITGHSFGASLQDIGLHTLSSRRRCCPDFSAPIFRGSNLD